MIAYIITNVVNNKQYVGITKTSLRRRWTNHLSVARRGISTALCHAIRKYGENVFIIKEIASSWSWDDLCAIEYVLIKQFNTRAPYGYNLTDGGEGVVGLDPKVRERITQANRNKKHSEKAKELIGKASKGHPVTPEMREAIGASHRGKKLSQEHRAKLSAAKMGKKMPPRTDEHKARISVGLVAAHIRRKALPRNV